MSLSSIRDFWPTFAADALRSTEPKSHLDDSEWEAWLRMMFPGAVTKPFAPHHRQFWQHVWKIERGFRPRPWIAAWPRGGGKSASAELAVIALGARGKRRYAVYVCDTQAQADKRLETIGEFLESEGVALHYPQIGSRATGKYGASKGWRRERLRTAGGFVVDSLGLDTAARGLRVESQRPDLLVLDDLDSRHDSAKITRKKIEIVTQTILPIGAGDMAVIGVQNLIIPNGIFAQLVSGKADFLIDRIVSGPIPAISGTLGIERVEGEDGEPAYRITSGEATWEGQSLEICERELNTVGPRAFRREQQHEVHDREGALWKREMIRSVAVGPDRYKRIVVAVDPSGGSGEIGIIGAGLGYDGLVYIIKDASQPGHKGPENWGRAVVDLYDELRADRIVAERNYGGDMVAGTIQAAAGAKLPVLLVTASRGKAIRAEPVVAFYEAEKIIHIGEHAALEAQMVQWEPGDEDSPDRVDALVFGATELLLPSEPQHRRVVAARPPGL